MLALAQLVLIEKFQRNFGMERTRIITSTEELIGELGGEGDDVTEQFFHTAGDNSIKSSALIENIKQFFIREIKKDQSNEKDSLGVLKSDKYLSFLGYSMCDYLERHKELKDFDIQTLKKDLSEIIGNAEKARDTTLSPNSYLTSFLIHKVFQANVIRYFEDGVDCLVEEQLENINNNIPSREQKLLEEFYNNIANKKKVFSIKFQNFTPQEITNFVEKLSKNENSKIRFEIDSESGNNIKVSLKHAKQDEVRIEALDIIYNYCLEYNKSQERITNGMKHEYSTYWF